MIVAGVRTITVTLSGSATLASYQAAIQQVTFASTAESAAARIINVTVNDGTANSNTAVTTINYTPVNDVPIVSAVSATETQINFTITDPDDTSFDLVNSPVAFDTAFGAPALVVGANLITPTQQASVALSGTLQVTDGDVPANVIGLFLGTGGANTVTAPLAGSPNAMYGFGGNDLLTGSTAADFLFGGTGNDTLTGGSGADTLVGEANNDTLVGDQGDTLLDGGADNDTLSVGANFTSTTNGQIVNIENVTLTAAVTLNLSNQTEGFKITGSSGADTITGGSGNDIFIGGAGQDTLTGGLGNDAFKLDGSFDIITDFASADDILNFVNFSLANHAVTGPINSVVTVTAPGNSIAGADLVVFNVTADNADSTAEINTLLQNQTGDFNGGVFALAYSDAVAGQPNRVALYYDSDADGGGSTSLIAVFTNYTSVTASGVPNIAADYASVASVIDPLILDLGAPGLDFSGILDGVSFDINADGLPDQMAWTVGEDGILALDVDGNGLIDNGSEIFSPAFAGGEHAGSLAALASLDANGDGLIDSGDSAYGSLKVWQDLNHDGVSDAGELTGLAALGITGINLGATPVDGYLNGQQLLSQGTFNYADGSTGSFTEVGFETELASPESLHSEPFQGYAGGGETYLIGANEPLTTIYGFVEGDSLDLSALLDANFAAGDNVDDFVRLQESGADITVQVDTNGPTGGANFVDVVTLPGFGTGNADIVRAVFAGQEQQLSQ